MFVERATTRAFERVRSTVFVEKVWKFKNSLLKSNRQKHSTCYSRFDQMDMNIDKRNIFVIFVETLSLYIFAIWKSIVYNLFCRDGIYFDKILVSEYNLFKRTNKANLLIAFTSLSLVLLWKLFYLFCSSIVINTVIVTAGDFEP
jgi:hypothetical protein